MQEGRISVFYKGDGLIYSLRYNGGNILNGKVDRIFIINA
jgi:hypothetical protein